MAGVFESVMTPSMYEPRRRSKPEPKPQDPGFTDILDGPLACAVGTALANLLSSAMEGYLRRTGEAGMDLRPGLGLALLGLGFARKHTQAPGGELLLAVGNGVMGSWLASRGRMLGQQLGGSQISPSVGAVPGIDEVKRWIEAATKANGLGVQGTQSVPTVTGPEVAKAAPTSVLSVSGVPLILVPDGVPVVVVPNGVAVTVVPQGPVALGVSGGLSIAAATGLPTGIKQAPIAAPTNATPTSTTPFSWVEPMLRAHAQINPMQGAAVSTATTASPPAPEQAGAASRLYPVAQSVAPGPLAPVMPPDLWKKARAELKVQPTKRTSRQRSTQGESRPASTGPMGTPSAPPMDRYTHPTSELPRSARTPGSPNLDPHRLGDRPRSPPAVPGRSAQRSSSPPAHPRERNPPPKPRPR